MKNLVKGIFFYIGLLSSVAVQAQTYKIDPGHTAITTKVMRFGVVNVVGRFNRVSGSITYNPNDLSTTKGEIFITTDSYTANNVDGEAAVKGPGFLDVANFPEMKFSVAKLTKAGNGFMVEGSLILHGVTKTIIFPASINGPLIDLPTGKQSIGISGALVVNRQDYGLKMARKTPDGRELVGSEVAIEINLLAIAE